jgi:hypothetical protein
MAAPFVLTKPLSAEAVVGVAVLVVAEAVVAGTIHPHALHFWRSQANDWLDMAVEVVAMEVDVRAAVVDTQAEAGKFCLHLLVFQVLCWKLESYSGGGGGGYSGGGGGYGGGNQGGYGGGGEYSSTKTHEQSRADHQINQAATVGVSSNREVAVGSRC